MFSGLFPGPTQVDDPSGVFPSLAVQAIATTLYDFKNDVLNMLIAPERTPDAYFDAMRTLMNNIATSMTNM